MSQIKFSETAQFDLKRLHNFLNKFDANIADDAIEVILSAIEHLMVSHSGGSPVIDRPNVRKLVIDFGETGYLVFHKYYEKTDVTLVSTILHQKEYYNIQTIGLKSEALEEKKP